MAYLQKAFIEITTRCNLRCPMCIKGTACVPMEGDMNRPLFERIVRQLEGIRFLGLSGVGEPLLHPELIELIHCARESLGEGTVIGFNSNGVLIDGNLATALVSSGLDKLALSIDSLDCRMYQAIRDGSILERTLAGMALLQEEVGRSAGTRLRVGVQTVVMRENFRSLPGMVRFFGERGVRFFIISHLLPYTLLMESETAYDANSEGAIRIFEKFRKEFERKHITYSRYREIMQKFLRTEEEKKLLSFVRGIMDEAAKEDEYLNIPHILQRDEGLVRDLEAVFEEAAAIAQEYRMDLDLPRIIPSSERKCAFVEENSIFIDVEGKVYPCYFLWHSFLSFIHGRRKQVSRREMGDCKNAAISAIWGDVRFREFRGRAKAYDVPFCTDCNLAACCDYVMAEEFEHDCAGNTIPCGDCLWCKGIFKCLSS